MFKSSVRRPLLLAIAVSVVFAGMAAAGPAHAGCSVQPATSPPAPQAPALEKGGSFTNAVFHPGASDTARFVRVDRNAPPTIVGLWKFETVSDGTSPDGPPAGVTIDFGLQQWHSDGTELMNSASRRPGVGDVCMGAWERTGGWTYHLNHYALGWETNPPNTGAIDSAGYLGPTHIVMDVMVSPDGRSFTGRFQLTVYAAPTSNPFDEHTQIAYIQGTVHATRITADGR